MSGQSPVTAQQVAARLRPRAAGSAPVLPPSWTAAGTFFPFGDAEPPLSDYDQLVVASIAYDFTGAQPAMRVSLYLLEYLQFYDFLFTNGQWYRLQSLPGQAPTGYYGPFPTSLQIPTTDFLGQKGRQLQQFMGNRRNPDRRLGHSNDPPPGVEDPAARHVVLYQFRNGGALAGGQS